MDARAARGPLVGLAVVVGGGLALHLAGADLTALVPRSPLGAAVAAGLVAAVVGWTALARRVIDSRPVRGAVVLLPVVALSVWLVVPLLSDMTVQEDLLSGIPVAAPPVAAGTLPDGTTPDGTTPDGTTADATTADGTADATTADGTAGATTADASPVPPQVLTLGTGALRGLDGHRASGAASLLEASGTTFVRLADLDASRAPDVRVWLVPAGAEDLSAGGVDLGELKGNQGDANYPVAAGTDLAEYGTVLLWCRAFSVPIGAADLA